jgi:hypothetical protein
MNRHHLPSITLALFGLLRPQPSPAQPIEPPHPGGHLPQADCFPGPHSVAHIWRLSVLRSLTTHPGGLP